MESPATTRRKARASSPPVVLSRPAASREPVVSAELVQEHLLVTTARIRHAVRDQLAFHREIRGVTSSDIAALTYSAIFDRPGIHHVSTPDVRGTLSICSSRVICAAR